MLALTRTGGCVLMLAFTRFGEGSASDEPWEGAGEAQRRPVPTHQGAF
jgi:hypothetical protein